MPDLQQLLLFIAAGWLLNAGGPSRSRHAGSRRPAAQTPRRDSVQRGMHWLDRAAALMFIGFGLKLALSDNPTR
jgi:threonine/homoserine/homoserine lactone efflux protein